MSSTLNTVGSTTYERIKRDVIVGDLAPGSKLKLDGLKERYKASVSTLRETLNRLASEGFVVAAEQRGFFVRPVSRDDLIEITDLRILLECSALETSILAGDADWEGNVVAAHHKLHKIEQKMMAGDQSQKELWKRYDWEFHQALIQACNSQNLLSLHATIFDKYLRYQMLVLTYRGDVATDEHREMLDAALARDVGRAKDILEAHIRKGLAHTLAEMSETNADF
ncbi:GntR family transcriptional regulator [Planktotalea frisia]|jgi:DNA-binding GntR family transcriptional regulator|uniref:DNA-binding transcriptional regulator CsiR n=1 Tax=Planktotalea frisia TaxID=696762 RepID=A0A1L9NYQ2_9RHOB|nr:GntR family transcriptional regulator [Planktotalea frisia]OJI94332.1 DNA-binding transcriptional regulator CsiR [Planktotalea frisia]PZX30241.1 GntR family transcriptional regulator [Planktotalea frisia]